MTENNFSDDFIAELISDLLVGQDIEEIAKALKLNPNTLQCFAYKSKAQIPNLRQFGIILDSVIKVSPLAVLRAFKKLGARYAIFCESLDNLKRDVGRNNGG
jgi:hypothetical protein